MPKVFALFIFAVIYSINASQAQGGFITHDKQASEKLSPQVLPYVVEIEKISNSGQTVGCCGEAQEYSQEQHKRLGLLCKKLIAMGPKVVPDMVTVIESSGFFAPPVTDISRRSRNRDAWARRYRNDVCVSILAAIGTPSIEYICRSQLPATGERDRYVEELLDALGSDGARKVVALLTSKNENTKYWARQQLSHFYSYCEPGKNRFNFDNIVLADSMLALSKAEPEKEKREVCIDLVGKTSRGDSASINTLIWYLQKDPHSHVRNSCVHALVNTAAYAPETPRKKCLEAVRDAMKSEKDGFVLSSARSGLADFKTAAVQEQERLRNEEIDVELRKFRETNR